MLSITSLLAFLVLSTIASAYDLTYPNKDNGLTPTQALVPSVYTANQCTVNIYLRDSAGSSAPFTITDHFYSPNYQERAYSVLDFDNNISCRVINADPVQSTIPLNGFFESATNTTYTSDTFNSWLNTTYDCDFDSNELFIYDNTMKIDSFGNYPFGYIENTGGYCQVGSAGSLPSTSTQLNALTNYLTNGYYTVCGSFLEIAELGGASANCALNRFFGTTFWYLVPFNSMYSGIVNISIADQEGLLTGICNGAPPMACTTNKIYIWDTVTGATTSISSSLPFTTEQYLIPNREYWLFIGSQCVGATGGSGSCTAGFNHTDYNMTIWAYEPDFECGEWSDCSDGIQTRLCIDPLGKVPNKIESRTCFVAPTVDIDLGFEDFYNQDVWICQKDYWLVTCTERLESIPAKYPVNWSVIGSPIGEKNLENFITVSQDWASKGSSSLKLWYYPPKNEEPVAPTPVCGNATTGRFAQITSAYNESLFIARNVSFESPYIQMRFDVKKCALPVVQYDYGTWFACGKKCYANNCSVEPEGRYGIRITDDGITEECVYPTFAFYDESMNDETVNVTDGDINTYSEFTSVGGALVNSSTRIFENGTFINFTLNVTGGILNLCLYDNNSIELTRFVLASADTLYDFNYTFGNLTQPLYEINLVQCNAPSRNVRMRLFSIRNHVRTSRTNIILDYYDQATIEKQNKILDFSNLGLQTNHNYTIAIAVNPENVFDPNSHCIYLDDFSITFTDVELPDCESYCDGLTYYSAYFVETGICAFTIIPVSSNCITDPNVQQAIDDNTNFEFEDEYYVWNNQTGEWETVDVPPPSEQEAQQISLYAPPVFLQEIFIGFGLTQIAFGYIWFFFSLFMIINYIALGIAIAITVFLKPANSNGKNNDDTSFIPFMIAIIIIIVGATFSGFYPLEIGIPIIVAIGLMLWKQMEGIVGGNR